MGLADGGVSRTDGNSCAEKYDVLLYNEDKAIIFFFYFFHFFFKKNLFYSTAMVRIGTV